MIYHAIAYNSCSQRYIHQPSMWWLANNTLRLKTRLIWIHIIHQMLAPMVASTTLQSQLPMGFTLPLTRLAFKDLRSPTNLTTWVSTLYVRLTNSLECQDANIPYMLHAKIMSNLSIPVHIPFNTCKFTHFML